jgi:hypothetical protein
MIPCKPGEKGPELDTGGKSLDEVSFADAFIEIKSRNMEFVTKDVRIKFVYDHDAPVPRSQGMNGRGIMSMTRRLLHRGRGLGNVRSGRNRGTNEGIAARFPLDTAAPPAPRSCLTVRMTVPQRVPAESGDTIMSCRNASAEYPDPDKAAALRKQLPGAYGRGLAKTGT